LKDGVSNDFDHRRSVEVANTVHAVA